VKSRIMHVFETLCAVGVVVGFGRRGPQQDLLSTVPQRLLR